MATFNDPEFRRQDYMGPTGINSLPLYSEYTGKGVRIGVVDLGVHWDDPDLIGQVDTTAGWDGVTNTPDAYIAPAEGLEHGTVISKYIAGLPNNENEGVGVAYGATIVPFKIGPKDTRTPEQELAVLQRQWQVDISNNSWGLAPFEDNFLGVYQQQGEAVAYAATVGRDGLGTIWIRSAGNTVDRGDDVGLRNYANNRFTMTIGSTDIDENLLPDTTRGAVWIVGPAPGTSWAAGFLSGTVALMLEANPNLGYRDVQQIIAMSARIPVVDDPWIVNDADGFFNGGGIRTSRGGGFGILDALAAVRIAESWDTAPKTEANILNARGVGAGFDIPDNTGAVTTSTIEITSDLLIERVTVTLDLSHFNISDLKLWLVSPSGTRAVLMDRTGLEPDGDTYGVATERFPIGVNQFYGETSRGTWTLEVQDIITGNLGTIANWELDLHGAPDGPDDVYFFNDDYAQLVAVDPTRGVLVDPDGGLDRLNAAAVTTGSRIDLTPGGTGSLIAGAALGIGAGTVIERAWGGDGDDTLIGNAVDNTLSGERGNDLLQGAAGNDSLDGWRGADTAAGGPGDDLLGADDPGDSLVEAPGEGRDTVVADISWTLGDNLEDLLLRGPEGAPPPAIAGTGNALDNGMTGNAAANTLAGADGADTLRGEAGDDSLAGEAGADRLEGGAGLDTLAGGADGDTYAVDGPADTILEAAGGGADTIEASVDFTLPGAAEVEGLTLVGDAIAGTGNALANTILGNAQANLLAGDEGDDTLLGEGGPDTLRGEAGGDSLLGGAGEDVLEGGEGADSLDGGGGANALRGGLGGDAYFVDAAADAVEEAAGAGNDTVFALADHTLAAGQEIETLSLLAPATAGAGNAGANRILGHEGANLLSGAGGADTLEGGDGADTLSGGAEGAADLLQGGAGDDLFRIAEALDLVEEGADSGNDTVEASVDHVLAAGQSIETLVLLSGAVSGTGNAFANTLLGNAAANLLAGGDGADTLTGAGGADTLDGGEGADSLEGGAEADSLAGGAGADTLAGGGGADALAGGEGDDLYRLADALDTVTEAAGGGADTVEASVSVTLTASQEIETLVLVGAAASGTGNALANAILGNAGANTLAGAAGADTLTGGAGDDSLDGGDGVDVAVFSGANADYLVTALGGGAYRVQDLRDGAPDGTDTIAGIETARFADGDVAAALLAGASAATNGPDSLRGGLAAETIDGLGGNDSLTGLTGDDRLLGRAGDDSLTGGLGRDALLGAAGADTLSGGQDGDTLDGGSEADDLRGGLGADSLVGGDGADSLDGGAGVDTVAGGAGNDSITVDDATDLVAEAAGEGADTVAASVDYALGGGQEVETLRLLDGAISGTGNGFGNTLLGNAGANTLAGVGGNDTLEGNAGADALDGGIGTDRLAGGAGDDSLVGGADADTLLGGDDADNLDGGAGADSMAGGAGGDRYAVDNALDAIAEAAGEGGDTVEAAVDYTLAAGQEIETLVLLGAVASGIGNGFANAILGNAAANQILGGDGADTLTGGGAGDALDGGAGDDSLEGGTGVDRMIGGAGNDSFAVDEAADQVTEAAGGGSDTVFAGASYVLAAGQEIEALVLLGAALAGTGNVFANALTGNALANTLAGGGAADTLAGAEGADSLDGGEAADSLLGGEGGDTLDGGVGADRMAGGAGDDRYLVSAAGDLVTELAGEGSDTVVAAVSWTLGAEVEALVLTGSGTLSGTGNGLANAITGNTGANALTGAEGDDSLAGEAGQDTLLGGAGADSLDGGAGVDSMAGGAGDDRFVVDDALDTVAEAAGEGTDTVLSAVAWTLGAEFEALVLTGAAAMAGTGNALDNTIEGNAGENLVTGLDGNDSLTGGAARDTLAGAAGNDSLDGGAGADSMEGGTGNDLYVVDDALDRMSESGGGGTDTVLASVTWTLGNQFEALVLTGAAAVGGTGNGQSNAITGNAAANLISGLGGDDTLSGDAGADTLIGGISNDRLDGGAGPDSMEGGTGNDLFIVDDLLDVVFEVFGDGIDTVQSSVDFVLADSLEFLVMTGTGDIRGTGGQVNNIMTGNEGHNVLDGGDGADEMRGMGGNDTLIGGGIRDSLNGGEGNDSVAGGDGADRLDGGPGDDTINLETDDDTVVEGVDAGYDTVIVDFSWTMSANLEKLILWETEQIDGTGNDIANEIIGSIYSNAIAGAGGNDTLYGRPGRDTLSGDAGDDLLDGDLGDDSIAGGAGADTAAAGDGYDTLDGGEGSDSLDGAGYTDTVAGGLGDDTLAGGDWADTLDGGEGADSLDGGAGVDSMTGGAGDDIYAVDDALEAPVEAPGGGNDTIAASLSWTLAAEFEGLRLTGSAAIDGTGNTLANTMTGNAAANGLSGADGSDTLSGEAGADTLGGGNGLDSLDGGSGADSLVGGAGNDVYVVDDLGDVVREAASGGNDTVAASVTWTLGVNLEGLVLVGEAAIGGTGNALANSLTGNAAANLLSGLGGHDSITGGGGGDTLLGSAGNDRLDGGDGNDSLDGGAGNDSMAGGAGDDLFVVDNALDVVSEAAGAGADTVFASVTWTLGNNLDALVLVGNAAIGGTGNGLANSLTGNGAANALSGGSGQDTLDGGAGADSLTGGAGADAFRFAAPGLGGADTIADFAKGQDKLWISSAGFGGLLPAGALDPAAFTPGTAAIGAGPQLLYDATTGALAWDADGAGGTAAVQVAVLAGLPGLDATDVLVVA